jgi:endonuclease YncB( thermonuclease family)
MKLTIISILILFNFSSFGNAAKVKRIIDGDTFEVETGEKIRLIGINAPEISDIFGQDSKQHLSKLIANKTVYLKTDNISNNQDRHQRLLRYVFLDEVDINKKMISDGFAFAYLKYHFSSAREYKRAQIMARENNKGIWGNGGENNEIKGYEQKKDLKQNPSIKIYLLGLLIIILLIIGFYTYYIK